VLSSPRTKRRGGQLRSACFRPGAGEGARARFFAARRASRYVATAGANGSGGSACLSGGTDSETAHHPSDLRYADGGHLRHIACARVRTTSEEKATGADAFPACGGGDITQSSPSGDGARHYRVSHAAQSGGRCAKHCLPPPLAQRKASFVGTGQGASPGACGVCVGSYDPTQASGPLGPSRVVAQAQQPQPHSHECCTLACEHGLPVAGGAVLREGPLRTPFSISGFRPAHSLRGSEYSGCKGRRFRCDRPFP
jgi:hypothetical protein